MGWDNTGLYNFRSHHGWGKEKNAQTKEKGDQASCARIPAKPENDLGQNGGAAEEREGESEEVDAEEEERRRKLKKALRRKLQPKPPPVRKGPTKSEL